MILKQLPLSQVKYLHANLDSIQQLNHSLSSIFKPSLKNFTQFMSAKGFLPEDHLVLVDPLLKFSPKLWVLLKGFGHENVSVYAGSESVLESSHQASSPSNYLSHPDPDRFVDYETMRSKLADFMTHEPIKIIDTREHHAWAGYDTSLDMGGHIPTSINIPHSQFFSKDTHTFIPQKDMIQLLAEKKLSLKDASPWVVLSDHGYSASSFILLMHSLGRTQKTALYTGNWIEWAKAKDSFIHRYR
jgi:3-mercaptopyruvate sulfurtransferase SseA